MEDFMRNCKRCGENKPLRLFSKDRQRKDGIAYYCKSCQSISHAERRKRWAKENNIPDEMQCIKCEKTLPNTDFGKDKSRPKGIRPECKNCRKILRSDPYRNTHAGWCRVIFSLARRRAKEKGLPFSLVPEDVPIPEVCPVLGIPLNHGTGRRHDGSPTIDRIINDLGYVKGNVIVISWRANRIKSDATLDELRAITSFYEGIVA